MSNYLTDFQDYDYYEDGREADDRGNEGSSHVSIEENDT